MLFRTIAKKDSTKEAKLTERKMRSAERSNLSANPSQTGGQSRHGTDVNSDY
jgi:ribosomal protein L4